MIYFTPGSKPAQRLSCNASVESHQCFRSHPLNQGIFFYTIAISHIANDNHVLAFLCLLSFYRYMAVEGKHASGAVFLLDRSQVSGGFDNEIGYLGRLR